MIDRNRSPEATARRRVLRQLIEALMFEGALIPSIVYRETASDGRTYSKPSTEPIKEEIKETIEETIIKTSGGISSSFPSKKLLLELNGINDRGEPVAYRCRARTRFTFGWIQLLAEPVLRIEHGASKEAEDLSLFIKEVLGHSQVSHSILPSFYEEIEATFRNERHRLTEGRPWRALLEMQLAEIEAQAADGHPYHPCFRSRIGFELEDQRAYAPEYGPTFTIMWVAAPQDEVHIRVRDGQTWEEFIQEELSEEELAQFHEQLVCEGVDPAKYRYLPVHPWQWQRYLSQTWKEAIHLGTWIPLGRGQDRYRPQQSIRTLTNRSGSWKADLKLSLHIVNTSSLRDLTLHSVASAPDVSSWLQQIVASDKYFSTQTKVVLLQEYAGISYLPAEGAASAIWREPVQKYLAEGEDAFPFHAMLAVRPQGEPEIAPWLKTFGVERWFRELIRKSVVPVVHLLVAHGIVLESHAQNMILIHQEGWPVGVALRDFHEGVEYYPPFLKSPELVPNFAELYPTYKDGKPGDYFEMESVESLQEMMIDALWFMNIGYLIMHIAEYVSESSHTSAAVEEQRLWQQVVQELSDYREQHPELEDRFVRLNLQASYSCIEPLAQKRMYGQVVTAPRQAPNPLFWASRKEREWEHLKEDEACLPLIIN
ncbi:IucA/IucC family protein [Paenibacillus sp. 1001270B_150601_E10]|uniref:IucA/IucC family protein n=1 Tax=Paenibacillus sp. 1001270B_150601_E10 TaxID=2787079 RepID=UPI001E498762|nr:IucA/IucC family protein [Paenibacillus sp. 1001270B_150601_E10]